VNYRAPLLDKEGYLLVQKRTRKSSCDKSLEQLTAKSDNAKALNSAVSKLNKHELIDVSNTTNNKQNHQKAFENYYNAFEHIEKDFANKAGDESDGRPKQQQTDKTHTENNDKVVNAITGSTGTTDETSRQRRPDVLVPEKLQQERNEQAVKETTVSTGITDETRRQRRAGVRVPQKLPQESLSIERNESFGNTDDQSTTVNTNNYRYLARRPTRVNQNNQESTNEHWKPAVTIIDRRSRNEASNTSWRTPSGDTGNPKSMRTERKISKHKLTVTSNSAIKQQYSNTMEKLEEVHLPSIIRTKNKNLKQTWADCRDSFDRNKVGTVGTAADDCKTRRGNRYTEVPSTETSAKRIQIEKVGQYQEKLGGSSTHIEIQAKKVEITRNS
jgi:hypothetical protein